MAPFEPFAHYLAYGATDQKTFRELRDSYSGVLVPATIAAYQRQGTGGFVLSLSATSQAPPYLIDPRFPLFQQALSNPKKSHTALAELLGDPGLVVSREPTPDSFTDARIAEIAQRWVEFNSGYVSQENAKFEKYAARLGEPVPMSPEQAQAPENVLAPYFACEGPNDPWWERSMRFFEHTKDAAVRHGGPPAVRVVCARTSAALDPLLAALDEPEQLVVWVDGLDEHRTSARHLIDYRRALRNAAAHGHQPFALYGGFFSVLLGNDGLTGASHGVGFSEHRAWRELPEGGAPPARYYMRRVHRYVPQDLAQALYEVSANLTECHCPHCAGRPPIALDYHELMKHSVACRAEEIGLWYGRRPVEAADILADEHDALSIEISQASLAPRIAMRAEASIDHLPEWVAALRSS
jgi:hypothetical protein